MKTPTVYTQFHDLGRHEFDASYHVGKYRVIEGFSSVFVQTARTWFFRDADLGAILSGLAEAEMEAE